MLKRLFGKSSETQYKVSIPTLGAELDVPRDSTILEFALSKGIGFPHSCRVGTCVKTCVPPG